MTTKILIEENPCAINPSSLGDGERVLVSGPAHVGDVVMSQALYQSLHRHNPHVRIDVSAPPSVSSLLLRMPEVTRIIHLPEQHGKLQWRMRYRCSRQLKKERYQRAFVLKRSMKAALLPALLGIPQRIGYLGELRWWLLNDIRHGEQALPAYVQRLAWLGEPRGTAPPPLNTLRPSLVVDQANQSQCLERLRLKRDGPILALIPGAAYGPSKCWPSEYFSRVVEMCAEEYAQIWVLGVGHESGIAREIQDGAGPAGQQVVNLCGKTSLCDAIDLLAMTSMVVSNDSGLMHVSAAVGRPVVAVYGSTSPSYAPPLCASMRQLSQALACSPCRKPTCRYGHYQCLHSISPEQVVEALRSLA